MLVPKQGKLRYVVTGAIDWQIDEVSQIMNKI